MPTESASSAQSVKLGQVLQNQFWMAATLTDETPEPAQLQPSRTNYMFGNRRHPRDIQRSARAIRKKREREPTGKNEIETRSFAAWDVRSVHDRALEIFVGRSDGSGGMRGCADGYRDDHVPELLHRARRMTPAGQKSGELSVIDSQAAQILPTAARTVGSQRRDAA